MGFARKLNCHVGFAKVDIPGGLQKLILPWEFAKVFSTKVDTPGEVPKVDMSKGFA